MAKIGNFAFYECSSLKTVNLGDNFEKVPSEWFENLPKDYEII